MKRFLALFLVLLFLLPTQAFAHSKLTTSSPEKNATLEASPTIISMEFNTDISAISTFVIENEQGAQVEIKDIQVEGTTLYGTPVHTLDNGSYQVKWTIIGADGHTVEGTYSFNVNAPEPAEQAIETTPETTEEPISTDAPVSTDAPAATTEPASSQESAPAAKEYEGDAEKTSSIALPIVIVGLIIVLAAFFATKRTKR